MKSRIVLFFFLALFASCGMREELKEDITLPEIPSAPGNSIKVIWPKSSQSFDVNNDYFNILYVKWEGLKAEDTARIDLYKDSSYCMAMGEVTGISEYYWRIPDTLETSPRYNIKVSNENVPEEFSFSEPFPVKGVEKDSSEIPIE